MQRTDTTEATTARREKATRPRGRSLWFKRSIWMIVIAVIVAAVAMAYRPKAVTAEMAVVEQGPLIVTVDEDGRTRVKDRYVISAPMGARMSRLELEAGDRVQTGQIVARLFPAAAPILDARTRAEAEARVAAALAAQGQARAARRRARADLDYAQKELARKKDLAQQNIIARETFDQLALQVQDRQASVTSAEFGIRVAAHELELARATLRRFSGSAGSKDAFEITCPVDGVVLKVMNESEGVIQAGTPLIEVGDPAGLEVIVDVLTQDAVHVAAGSRATIVRWGGKEALDGHVRKVEPSAFTRTSALGVEEQRVWVVIDIDSPRASWSSLGDGFRVEARIVVWEAPDAIKIPTSAIFRHDKAWAVYRVTQEIAQLQEVEIGQRNGREAQVLDGLQPADHVIVYPSDAVGDGVRVKSPPAP